MRLPEGDAYEREGACERGRDGEGRHVKREGGRVYKGSRSRLPFFCLYRYRFFLTFILYIHHLSVPQHKRRIVLALYISTTYIHTSCLPSISLHIYQPYRYLLVHLPYRTNRFLPLHLSTPHRLNFSIPQFTQNSPSSSRTLSTSFFLKKKKTEPRHHHALGAFHPSLPRDFTRHHNGGTIRPARAPQG